MTLSLDLLKPRAVRVEIFDNYGHSIGVVPMKTLSYTEWNNAALMVSPPSKSKRLEIGEAPVDITHTPEYRQKIIAYNEEITLRRIALALAGGGAFPEMDSIGIDEQVNIIRGFDTGIINGLTQFLSGVALRTSADIFRPKSLSGNGNDHLPKAEEGLVVVDGPESD